MCRAFSALITKSKKVYWKAGVDSHDLLQSLFEEQDKELKDDKKPPKNTFARIEIVPEDENYLNPKQKWVLKIDEEVAPEWWNKSYEKPCYEALKKWQNKVYSSFNLEEALNPIHPFKIRPPKITKEHIEAVRLWASVRDSVRDSIGASVKGSVGDSVWASIWDSIGASVKGSVGDSVWVSIWDLIWNSVVVSVRDSVDDSVWASVKDSVWDSVWNSVGYLVRASVKDSVWASVTDSVWAYIGSLFPSIKKWKYVDYRKKPFNQMRGKYPFYPAVWLWKQGLVPSFDGEKWRLHGYQDARILWEEK